MVGLYFYPVGNCPWWGVVLEPQIQIHMATHPGVRGVPAIVADRAPDSVDVDLHPALERTVSPDQADPLAHWHGGWRYDCRRNGGRGCCCCRGTRVSDGYTKINSLQERNLYIVSSYSFLDLDFTSDSEAIVSSSFAIVSSSFAIVSSPLPPPPPPPSHTHMPVLSILGPVLPAGEQTTPASDECWQVSPSPACCMGHASSLVSLPLHCGLSVQMSPVPAPYAAVVETDVALLKPSCRQTATPSTRSQDEPQMVIQPVVLVARTSTRPWLDELPLTSRTSYVTVEKWREVG